MSSEYGKIWARQQHARKLKEAEANVAAANANLARLELKSQSMTDPAEAATIARAAMGSRARKVEGDA